MKPNYEDAIATIVKAWEGRKDAPDYPDYDDINMAIGSLEEAVKVLNILKGRADTYAERTDFDFKTGEEREHTAIVIEIWDNEGSDYETIKNWLSKNHKNE